MDNGAAVCVSVKVDREKRSAIVDFEGTSPQQPNNFNAPYSICRAATLYVFRTLVEDAIPMNDGCLRPITLKVPEGSMLNPLYPAAVVAGNVETSQVITDALFAACRALAPSQGTMNNFTFGNSDYQYYETIAGGAGAGPDFDGASAVQTHMTNSRLTDPEILETRFPVLLERFAIRRGSGGARRRRGGDGSSATSASASGCAPASSPTAARAAARPRRRRAGAAGINQIIRADGSVETLGAHRLVRNGARRHVRDRNAGGGRVRGRPFPPGEDFE
jgi:5-oxoprolinase (ATP-hydrolysing)